MQALYFGDKIETLWFETLQHQYYIPRDKLEELCGVPSPDQNKSPKMTKNSSSKKLSQKAQQAQEVIAKSFDRRNLPASPVNEYGITNRLLAWFEVSICVLDQWFEPH
jgi:hypothetical protein